ncbi:MAG: hypothetical protein ACI965_002432, partial [Paraglaciecola sp.]
MFKLTKQFTLFFFLVSLAGAFYVNFSLSPTWVESQLQYETYINEQGQSAYKSAGNEIIIERSVDYTSSPLHQSALDDLEGAPEIFQQWVYLNNQSENLLLLKADFHFGLWSLLPAFVAIALCLITREPLVALLGGIVVGAVMLGRFDITHEVFIPNVGTSSAASILILYLWLLGGLMGVWAKTGAAQAFANHMSEHYVKGPRSAKLVAWFLGIIFFQGGTMSTVLVGTTVKPIADKANV